MRAAVRWLFPIGTFLLRFLPYAVAAAMASAIADVGYLLLADRRRILQRNLAHVLPDAPVRIRRRLARATLRNFALMYVDFLMLPILDEQTIRGFARWQGREQLDAAVALGRGVVLVTPHVGAFAVAGAFLAAHGYAATGVVEDLEPPTYEILRQYRTVHGAKVLSRREAVSAYRVLRRGEVLTIVADRLIGGPGVAVQFCGAARMIPTGPAAFALRARAPLVVWFMVRDTSGSARYRLVTEEMRMPSGSVEDITRSLACDFARIVRDYPDQWYVFQPGWIEETPTSHDPPLPPGRASRVRGRR
jgi:phosphatidylinositol dimannoside acyltransferase